MRLSYGAVAPIPLAAQAREGKAPLAGLEGGKKVLAVNSG